MSNSGNFLSPEFLAKYDEIQPRNKGILFEPVFYRTYSRYLPEKKRRETWLEVITRVVEASMKLYQGPANRESLVNEAETLFDRFFHLEAYPAGRTYWIAGTKPAEQFGESSFNCCYTSIDKLSKFCDIFHLLMCGCGVGYGVLKEDIDKLPILNSNIILDHMAYDPKPKAVRQETTSIFTTKSGDILMEIGDSKLAWVDALRQFLSVASDTSNPLCILIYYNSIRPSGERIKTFGGRAAGPDGIKEMFEGINSLIKECGGKLTPTACMDIANTIAKNVLVGGVRRSAQIALGCETDEEFEDAKVGLFTCPTKKNKRHRVMSNNSLVFKNHPSKDRIRRMFERIKVSWEPGFLNQKAAKARRAWFSGVNPCISKDTWIFTDKGPRKVEDLLDKGFKAVINDESFKATKFFKTGTKDLYTLDTKEGYSLEVTEDHKIHTTRGWVEAKDLVDGDFILLNKCKDTVWGGVGNFDEGWLVGNLIGDGNFVKNTRHATLKYWGNTKEEVSQIAFERLNRCVDHSPLLTINRQKDGVFNKIQCVGLSHLAEKFGITVHDKVIITKEIEEASEIFYRGFLQGIFDADGSVQGCIDKGRSVRLCQSNEVFLQGIQRMLLRLGIRSTLCTNRYPIMDKLMPNGKGGLSFYTCRAVHELIISRDSMYTYAEKIGFTDPDKMRKLNNFVSHSNKRRLYKDKFEARFESLTFSRVDDVYDCTVDTVHEFDANGLKVHNCGEALLADKGNCNLSGINLMAFVKDGKFDLARAEENIRLVTRLGLRQTNISWSLPEWEETHKRDRLLGVSLTAIMDAFDSMGIEFDSNKAITIFEQLKWAANDEADKYAFEMRVPRPLLVTLVKPEGTISKLMTVSAGMARDRAPYYIRRIRVSELDPVCQALKEIGVPNEPDKSKPDRVVFSFPIKSECKISANDESAIRQYERYLTLQKYYCDHNTSCTINVGEDEWEGLVEKIYENWDDTIACAFAAKDYSQYPQLPEEPITKEQYDILAKDFPDMSNLHEIINKYELENGEEFELDNDCKTGFCPVR